MKKRLGLLLSSFVIFSLISCNKPQEQQDNSKSSQPILITEPLDSSVIDISGQDSKVDVYYHVTFVNYDNSVLYEVDVLEGSEALYSGEDPVKEEDDEFTYEFIGWDVDLKTVSSDMTAKAVYEYHAKENWGPIHWF